MGSIAVAGTDFHHLTLAQLERAKARAGGATSLAGRLRALLGGRDVNGVEVVALTTCNRIEAYVATDRELSADELASAFHELVGAAGFVFMGDAAARHLLRVACSLESAVVGEDQILGQVRDSSAAARDAGTNGPRLTSLFDLALRVGKRVRRETALAHLGTDLARLTLRHLKAQLRADAGAPIALLGTGAMARAVLTARPKDGREGWLVVGRDAGRTAAFAREFGAESQTLDAFINDAREARDARPLRALIAATSTKAPLIDVAFVRRRLRPDAAVVDLGLPRNVAADVRDHAHFADLADLQAVSNENAARLASTLAQIERWIDESLARRARRARIVLHEVAP